MILNNYLMEPIQLTDYPYEVYEDGTVFRTERKTRDGKKTLNRLQITPNRNTKGYLVVKLYSPKEDSYRLFYLHRLVYMAFYGEIADKMEIDHIDGNRQNCDLSNLQAVTHKDNCSNVVSIERYRRANALDKGKFNRDKMIAAQGQQNHDRLAQTYKRLVQERGQCGIWLLMNVGHCGYPRAKRVIEEQEGKNQ